MVVLDDEAFGTSGTNFLIGRPFPLGGMDVDEEVDGFDGNEDVGEMKRSGDGEGGGKCGGWRVCKKLFHTNLQLDYVKICLSSLKNSKLVGS